MFYTVYDMELAKLAQLVKLSDSQQKCQTFSAPASPDSAVAFHCLISLTKTERLIKKIISRLIYNSNIC